MKPNFSHLDVAAKKLYYKAPLTEGTIINRPNRFIAWVDLGDGVPVKCHTPVGGRIGGLTIDGLPCLLSGPHESRGTTYTVEAIGLGQKTDSDFQWIGIHQAAANTYVEAFLEAGLLQELAPLDLGLASKENQVLRRTTLYPEKKLGDSRIDFLLNGDLPEDSVVPEELRVPTWVEIKTPLIKLHTAIPATIPIREYNNDAVGGRMPKQITALFSELDKGNRVVLLACFLYENTLKTSDELRLKNNLDLDSLITIGRQKGLESWQIQFAVDKEGVSFRGLKHLK